MEDCPCQPAISLDSIRTIETEVHQSYPSEFATTVEFGEIAIGTIAYRKLRLRNETVSLSTYF